MLDQLIKEWLEEKDNISGLEKQLNMRKQMKVDLEKRIVEQMDNEGLDSVKTDDGSFSIKETLYASVNKADFDQAKKFFEDKGLLKNLITEEFLKGRLGKITRDLLASGEAPAFIKYYIKRYIQPR